MVLDHSYLTSHLWAHRRGLGVSDDSPRNWGEGGDEHWDGCRLLRWSNRHICMYVCQSAYIYLSIYLSIPVSSHVCMSICMFVSLLTSLSQYVHIYLSIYLSQSVRLSVCIYACMYVCMYVSIYISIIDCSYLFIYEQSKTRKSTNVASGPSLDTNPWEISHKNTTEHMEPA